MSKQNETGKLALDFKVLAKDIHHAVKENPDVSVRKLAGKYHHGPIALKILEKLKYIKASHRGNHPNWQVNSSPNTPEFDAVVDKAQQAYQKHLKDVKAIRHKTGVNIAKLWNSRDKSDGHKHGKGPAVTKATAAKMPAKRLPARNKFGKGVEKALQDIASSTAIPLVQTPGNKFSWPVSDKPEHAETLQEINVLLKEIQTTQHNVIEKLFKILFDL